MAMNPRLLRPILSGDPDALRYIAAVQAADQQSLEPAVRKAITDFITGCKADGIWSALKACCLLAGPRTLAGINVPLVGPTPTFNAFTATEYNRKTGLLADGSTMYIDSGRNNAAEPKDSQHLACYAPDLVGTSVFAAFMGGPSTSSGSSVIRRRGGGSFIRGQSRTSLIASAVADGPGFQGLSRNNSANFDMRSSGTTDNITATSNTPTAGNIFVFNAAATGALAGRLAFYSIGESINLALLDTRVSAYYTAIQAAI
jgi:hypothetical protein